MADTSHLMDVIRRDLKVSVFFCVSFPQLITLVAPNSSLNTFEHVVLLHVPSVHNAHHTLIYSYYEM